MSGRLRVGIVGAGHICEYHLRALQRVETASVEAISDLNVERANVLAKRFRIPRVFGAYEDMLAQNLDVVHILTFPASHADLAIQALEAGCHVMVEKPLATSEEDCQRILDTAEKADRRVCVDHAMLRDYFVMQLLDAVHNGKVGEVLSVDYHKSQVYPPYAGGTLPVPFREGGYPFRDVGVHALYLMQALLGEIDDVSAQYRRGTDPNLFFSDWRVLVQCRKGTGQIHLSWDMKPYQNVVTVRGTKGVLEADLFGMTVTLKKTRPMPGFVLRAFNVWSEGWQKVTQVPLNVMRVLFKRIRRYHGLQQMVIDFYTTLERGYAPPVSAEQAKPIVAWTEKVARDADRAKETYYAQFPKELTAKTLVTGGTGFIGGRLVQRLLEENERIRLFVRREPAAELRNDPRVEVVLGDLGDPDAVERAVAGTERIYHIGAAIRGSVADFDRGTIVGTQNIVESAVKHNVGGLVYISSLSVLHAAAARPGQAVREDWPLEPYPDRRGHYTRTKLEAENIVRDAVAKRGLRAVLLRPGQVFGPGAPLMTPAVAIRKGKTLIVLGNGQVVLPLVYVDDVIDAIQLAASKPERFDGSIYHLVDPTKLTQDDLIQRFQQATSDRYRVIHLPRFFVYSASLGVQMLAGLLRRSAPLSIYRVRSALARWEFDCRAAREELGWQPRVGVQAGLEKTL